MTESQEAVSNEDISKMKKRFYKCQLNNEQAEFLVFAEQRKCTLVPGKKNKKNPEKSDTVKVIYDPENPDDPDESKTLATNFPDTRSKSQNAVCCYARWRWRSSYLPKAKPKETPKERMAYIDKFQRHYGDPDDREYVEDREYKWYRRRKNGITKWYLSILDLEAAKEILLRDIQEIEESSGRAAKNGKSAKPNTANDSTSSRESGTDEIKLPEEAGTEDCHVEGAKKQITVNAYERNRKAREECIEAYGGPVCYVCRFDFGDEWGDDFAGFIHVHHRKALSEIGEEYQVDPIKDLVPVCPNCHAVVHHGGKTRDVEEVKKLWKQIHSRPARHR
jgi:hypothetical protein